MNNGIGQEKRNSQHVFLPFDDRNYLLNLTPRGLCQEFSKNASNAFILLAKGLLGISDVTKIHQSQFLINIVSVLYSTVSKVINRKATGYALLLTTAARDGGLREDSIKFFSILVHPRTSQKDDKEVLASGWNTELRKQLDNEREHFVKIKVAEKFSLVGGVGVWSWIYCENNVTLT